MRVNDSHWLGTAAAAGTIVVAARRRCGWRRPRWCSRWRLGRRADGDGHDRRRLRAPSPMPPAACCRASRSCSPTPTRAARAKPCRPTRATTRSSACCRGATASPRRCRASSRPNVRGSLVEVNKIFTRRREARRRAASPRPSRCSAGARGRAAVERLDRSSTRSTKRRCSGCPTRRARSKSIQFNQPLAVPVHRRRRQQPHARRAPSPARAPTRTPTRSTAWTSPTTSSATTSSRRCRRPSSRCRPRASRSSARPAPTPTPRSAAAAARSSSSSPSAAPTGSAGRPTGIARTTRSTRTAGTASGSAAEAAARGQPRGLLARRADRAEQDVLLHQLRSAPLPADDAGVADGADRQPEGRHPAVPRRRRQRRHLQPARARSARHRPQSRRLEPVGPAAGGQRSEPRRRVQHDRVHGGGRHLVQQRRRRAAARSQLLEQLAHGRQLSIRQHPRDRRGAGRHRRPAVRATRRACRLAPRICRASRASPPSASPASSRRGCSTRRAFSYVRGFLAFTRVSPFAQVAGTNVALDVGGTVDEPLDVAHRATRARRSPTRTTTSSINNSTLDARQAHAALRRHLAARVLVLPAQRTARRIADLAGGATSTPATSSTIPTTLRPRDLQRHA